MLCSALILQTLKLKPTLYEQPQDGMIEAHCVMLFPMSPYLSAVETTPFTAGPAQVSAKLDFLQQESLSGDSGGSGCTWDRQQLHLQN